MTIDSGADQRTPVIPSAGSPAQECVLHLARNQVDTYIRQPAELVGHHNRESDALDAYRGRQILELLQNADDAGSARTGSCKLRFDINRERLVVANTGAPFSPKGLMSLVVSDCSPKQLDRNRFIGSKGLGFRTILEWTARPLISSGVYEIAFDRAWAVEQVRALAEVHTAVRQVVEEFTAATRECPAAILRFPFVPDASNPWLAEARRWRAGGFDTVIVLPLDGPQAEQAYTAIVEQLTFLPATALLFCRALTEVVISGECVRRWDLDRKTIKEAVTSVVLTCDADPERWMVYSGGGTLSDAGRASVRAKWSDYQVAVAIPGRPSPNPEGRLCVFFPTQDVLPCSAVFHATLETTEDRNRLVEHTANREVLANLARHAAAVLEAETSTSSPTRALDLLAGIQSADPELGRMGFVSELVEEFSKRRLFPRADGTMRPCAEVLRAPHSVWSDVLDRDIVPELLMIGERDGVSDLLDVFRLRWLDPDELKGRLVRLLRAGSPSDAGVVLGKLLAAEQLGATGARGLLVDHSGSLIETQRAFFNPADALPELPAWASAISFVHPGFQAALMESSGRATLRSLAAELSQRGAEIDEYRFDSVARAMIAEVGAVEEDDRIDRWRDLLRWLFNASAGSRQSLRELSIQLVTTDGRLRRANECYLGDSYSRGRLLARLYGPLGEDEFAGSPAQCGLAGFPLEDAESFLMASGAAGSPRTSSLGLGPHHAQFVEDLLAGLPYPVTIRGRLCDSKEQVDAVLTSYGVYGLRTPDRWIDVLEKADCAAVVAYALSPDSPIAQGEYDTAASFGATVDTEWKVRDEASIRVPNPVLWSLRRWPWVSAGDGTRLRPSQITLSSVAVQVLGGVFSKHRIELSDPILSAYSRTSVESLLSRLGAVSSLEALAGGAVYDLLLSLPERNPDGQIARGIYRTLIESSPNIEPSPERDAFLRRGQIWSRSRGIDAYRPIDEVRYNSTLALTRIIEDYVSLADLPRRKKTTLVQELFGVRALTSAEVRLTLVPEGTEYDPESEEAHARFRSALPYVYALRLYRNVDERGRELSLLQRARLRVCPRARLAASLPDGRMEDIVLGREGERVVVESELIMVGAYPGPGAGALTFWLGVAELVSELLGIDVADEVGGVLRCLTTSEMQEVVRVRLGGEADAKLADAAHRFEDLDVAAGEEDYESPIPPPKKPPVPAGVGGSEHMPPDDSADGSDDGDDGGDTDTGGQDDVPAGTPVVSPTEGPVRRPIRRRKLVVVGAGLGGGGTGRGPIATEDVTFRVVTAFEESQGRLVIPVSHLHGTEGFGCDLLSVNSLEVRDAFRSTGRIGESDISRYIEVKGRSSRTGEVELIENEERAARLYTSRYWIYRVYVNPRSSTEYEVALLSDPLGSGAVRTVTRFDLVAGSGATFFTVRDVPAEE